MVHEIITHTNKVIKILENNQMDILHKIIDVSIEILVIVFAVYLSIRLHEWSHKKHEFKELDGFLEDIDIDLEQDLKNITRQRDELKDNISKNEVFITDDSNVSFVISPIMRKNSNGHFEALKSSGKISLLKNKKLKSKLLEYYLEDMISLFEIEKVYNDKLYNTLEIYSESKQDKSEILLKKVKNSFFVSNLLGNQIISVYDQMIESITDIKLHFNKSK